MGNGKPFPNSAVRVPKYRKHSQYDFGFVEYQGKRHRFPGTYNSPQSKAAYFDWCRQLVEHGTPPIDLHAIGRQGITVGVLAAEYHKYAQIRYAKSGNRGEFAKVRIAMRHLTAYFPTVAACEFGPKHIRILYKVLAQTPRRRGKRTLSCGYINDLVGRIKRMYRWAMLDGLVSDAAYHALHSTPQLKPGEYGSVTLSKRRPVSIAHVRPVMRKVSRIIRDMIRVQWITGVRSGSLVMAAPEQFDRSVTPWIWHPRHKQEHTGEVMVVYVGRKCRAILARHMEGAEPTDPLFSPRRIRKSQRYRKAYSAGSYRQAIARGIERANADIIAAALNAVPPIPEPPLLPPWTPHAIRHAKGHAIRKKHGIEAAQAVLGHASIDATEIYSARRDDLARRIAEDDG